MFKNAIRAAAIMFAAGAICLMSQSSAEAQGYFCPRTGAYIGGGGFGGSGFSLNVGNGFNNFGGFNRGIGGIGYGGFGGYGGGFNRGISINSYRPVYRTPSYGGFNYNRGRSVYSSRYRY